VTALGVDPTIVLPITNPRTGGVTLAGVAMLAAPTPLSFAYSADHPAIALATPVSEPAMFGAVALMLALCVGGWFRRHSLER